MKSSGAESLLTIGQVAARAGLRASAIRYYEAEGLLPVPLRRSGRRVYSTSVFERLAVIELAKTAGFQLKNVRALLSAAEEAGPEAAWRDLATEKAAEIDARIERLVESKGVLRKLEDCACGTLEECGRAYVRARSKEPPPARAKRS